MNDVLPYASHAGVGACKSKPITALLPVILGWATAITNAAGAGLVVNSQNPAITLIGSRFS